MEVTKVAEGEVMQNLQSTQCILHLYRQIECIMYHCTKLKLGQHSFENKRAASEAENVMSDQSALRP